MLLELLGLASFVVIEMKGNVCRRDDKSPGYDTASTSSELPISFSFDCIAQLSVAAYVRTVFGEW